MFFFSSVYQCASITFHHCQYRICSFPVCFAEYPAVLLLVTFVFGCLCSEWQSENILIKTMYNVQVISNSKMYCINSHLLIVSNSAGLDFFVILTHFIYSNWEDWSCSIKRQCFSRQLLQRGSSHVLEEVRIFSGLASNLGRFLWFSTSSQLTLISIRLVGPVVPLSKCHLHPWSLVSL